MCELRSGDLRKGNDFQLKISGSANHGIKPLLRALMANFGMDVSKNTAFQLFGMPNRKSGVRE